MEFNTVKARLRRSALHAHVQLALGRRRYGVRFPVPPGHFYSPVPDFRSLDHASASPSRHLPGIEMREHAQLALVRELAVAAGEQPFTEATCRDRRYYFDNEMFGYGDGLMLHLLLRKFRPSAFVEVGSGFSSGIALDTNELFLDGSMKCTFIEPHAERLMSLLRPGDEDIARIETVKVQQVPIEFFRQLGANDVLFIDSSHVSKSGSDVNYLVLEVLPTLAPGVLVHVHDVFFPFEYERGHYDDGWGWNEAFLLRAFLACNRDFRIVLFNSFLAATHRGEVAELLPLWDRNPGGSIWLQRV